MLLYPCDNVLEAEAAILDAALQYINTLFAVLNYVIKTHQSLQLQAVHRTWRIADTTYTISFLSTVSQHIYYSLLFTYINIYSPFSSYTSAGWWSLKVSPRTWNSLSADLRDPTCDESFRRSLKTFLFAKY